jgi:hypothetical protein
VLVGLGVLVGRGVRVGLGVFVGLAVLVGFGVLVGDASGPVRPDIASDRPSTPATTPLPRVNSDAIVTTATRLRASAYSTTD